MRLFTVSHPYVYSQSAVSKLLFCSILKYCLYTSTYPQTNKDPKKDTLQQESPFTKVPHFQMSCCFCWGVYLEKISMFRLIFPHLKS